MKSEDQDKKVNWAQAQRQATQMGIVLTRRKNSNGEYVCYLDKKSDLPNRGNNHHSHCDLRSYSAWLAELQRDADDYDQERVLAEGRHVLRNPDQNRRNVRRHA